MAKKIFALVATVVLVVCFAITVSAATVNTTTTYVAGGKADVTVVVTGVADDANVTYYATKDGASVFVDQKKADNGATFNFVTDIANVGSEVKVGYTNGTAAGDVIPDAAKYAIKYDGATLAQVYPGEGTVVTIANPAGEFETVTNVTATNATVSYDANETTISVTLSNVTGEVEIAVATEVIAIPDYQEELDIADAGAVVVVANADYEAGIKIDAVKDDLGEFTPDSEDADKIASANADKVGDRKLTVCGKAGNFDEYGIIVSEEAIETANFRPAAFEAAFADKKYEAATKAPDGKFAVQLIDISTAEEGTPFVVAGKPYYTAVYGYSIANQAYYVVAFANAVAAN